MVKVLFSGVLLLSTLALAQTPAPAEADAMPAEVMAALLPEKVGHALLVFDHGVSSTEAGEGNGR